MAILALGKAKSHREPNVGCRGLTDLGDVMLCQKSLHECCRMGRRIDMMKLICSLSHCEYDGRTVHKLSPRHLTAGWLAPRESDCSQLHSKVSDWLPNCIKATWLVFEIFKMARPFPNSHHIWFVSFYPPFSTDLFWKQQRKLCCRTVWNERYCVTRSQVGVFYPWVVCTSKLGI
jgi:hypothetical protein